MKRSTRLRATALAVGALLLVGVACGDEAENPEPQEEGGDATIEVTAADFSFTPEAVTVPAGAEVAVTFTNDGEAPHTMTADAVGLDLSADPGETSEGTFTAPDSGSVDFRCTIHPNMQGEIVVEGSEAGSDSEGSGDDQGGGGNYDY